MKTYNIQTKTPANSNWLTIHKGFDKESAVSFLTQMNLGGYDRDERPTAEQEADAAETMTTSYYTTSADGNDGDLVEYRAVEVAE